MKNGWTIVIGLLAIGYGKDEPSMSGPIGEVVKREQVIQFLETAKKNFFNQFGSKLDEPAFTALRD